MEDRLIIGYDESKEKDHTSLIVARQVCRGTFILNAFHDDEAREIYNKLTNKQEV